MGGPPIGLDMGAVMQMGAALSLDVELLAEVLPAIERAVLDGFDDDGGEGEDQ